MEDTNDYNFDELRDLQYYKNKMNVNQNYKILKVQIDE